MHTPRLWGHEFNAGTSVFLTLGFLDFLINWLTVAILISYIGGDFIEHKVNGQHYSSSFSWSSCLNAASISSSDNVLSSNSPIFLSLSLSWNSIPVPAGISLPTTTFSLSPLKWSFLPVTAASVKTLVVSWKDAADINESVANDAFVIPSNTL